MAGADYELPERQGLLTLPSLGQAGDLINDNERLRDQWSFSVAGVPAAEFIELVRDESVETAMRFCDERGIDFETRGRPVLATGHQPAFFHPGVWVKNFVADDLARRLDATAVNLIVDTDAAGRVPLAVPRWDGRHLSSTEVFLSPDSDPDVPYESLSPLPATALEDIAASVLDTLRALPDLGPASAFERFGPLLSAQATVSENVSELLASARRAYEQEVMTSYLELPVSMQSRTNGFLLFFQELAERIEEFQAVYNASLDEYRERHDVRSAAHPFPDLDVDGALYETPFWLMDRAGRRATLWLKREGRLSMVCRADGCEIELRRGAWEENIDAIRETGVQIRPKGLALTLFNRMFLADLFIHGFSGAKYDRATDELIRRLFGVEPPRYLAATATVRLETGVRLPAEERVNELRQRMHALKHNPDKFAGDPAIAGSDRERFSELVKQKETLVAEIERRGADKKSLGRRIRDVNVELERTVEPLADRTRRDLADLERLEESRAAAKSREWPFCYFHPRQIHHMIDHAMPCE